MRKYLSQDNDLPFTEKVIRQLHFWPKGVSLSEEKRLWTTRKQRGHRKVSADCCASWITYFDKHLPARYRIKVDWLQPTRLDPLLHTLQAGLILRGDEDYPGVYQVSSVAGDVALASALISTPLLVLTAIRFQALMVVTAIMICEIRR